MFLFEKRNRKNFRQHRTIPALRLKHRSGGCGTASALPKCSIMSSCGTRIVLRGQKPLALCDRCPCFGSLFPPLAALTFAASSIIYAFGLASAAPRSPYRHLELCGIAQKYPRRALRPPTGRAAGSKSACGPFAIRRAGCPHPAVEKPEWYAACHMFHHTILRTTAGARCAPLRVRFRVK